MASGERVPLARETATAPAVASAADPGAQRGAEPTGATTSSPWCRGCCGSAAALGWRLLVVVAALYVVGVVVSYLAAVVVPVAVALLLAALLSPAVHRLQDRRRAARAGDGAGDDRRPRAARRRADLRGRHLRARRPRACRRAVHQRRHDRELADAPGRCSSAPSNSPVCRPR